MSKLKLPILGALLILIIAAAYFWQAGSRPQKTEPPAGPPEKITIGTAFNKLSGLLYIAQNQGYDKAQGLEVAIKARPAGVDAVRDLRAGRLDLACCADFVLVSEIFAGAADLRCLAVFSSGANLELIARRDRGINRPEDLRGKTIGVPLVHSARFFLGRFLTFNHISLKEVSIVDVNPSDLAGALAAGKVDAVMAWEPLYYEIMQKMGNDAFSWPAQGDQDLFWLLVTREEVVKKRGAALEKVLRALSQAANFAGEKPEAAMEIISRWMKVPLADLQAGKFRLRYDLFLDQALLIAMEDQSRWMMRHKLTTQTRVPDFLDYLQVEPLARVVPKAVKIVIPKDERPRCPRAIRNGAGAPMRIRTRVKIGGALTICILLAYGALVLYLDRTMSRLAQEVKEANEFVAKIVLLRGLTQDFLLSRTERAQRQWSAVYEEIYRLLDNKQYRVLKGEQGIGDAPYKLKIVGESFSRLMTIRETPAVDTTGAETTGELQNRLTTQLLLATQDLMTRFFNLTEETNLKLIATQRLISSVDVLALLILGILMISNAVFLQRSVVKPVLKLHAGAEIIGSGNLNHQMGINSRDEIGQLSQAFDQMTANLQQVTVSRDELVKEIEERKRVEEALRESEEHYRSLFDHMLDGFAYCRMHFEQNRPVDFTYLNVNESFETLTGLKNVIGEKVSEVIPGIRESNPELFEIYGRVALTGKPERFETYLDPLKMWLSLSVYSPRKEYFVVVFDVITARKQAEEKLKRTLQDLERSNRDLEEFAFISSHDLQEPLRKIANFSEMLAKEYRDRLDERAVRYFGYVTEGAKRMQSLINDLLSYSRVGRAESPMIPADLGDILKGTLTDLHSLIQESDAQISNDPLPTLRVNSYQMRQLLQNLLANAIKFHGGQRPRIHLSARREGREWVIAVRDNGIGFDPRYAEGIFKVFKRLHGREKYPGTGIGLAICKKIVERHGGRIWAESEPGVGSTFFFTIPA